MLAVFILLLIVVGLFVSSFIIDKNTKIPKGCNADFSGCHGCGNFHCGHHQREAK
ncbi:MAG: FeoB-associated Cys-rich membrane protein [Bacilli bacterium]|jgi:hypothetical protein|nr:FeoB-associated Cys-rich membrane protein [Bacilli bacterium]